MVQSSGVNFSLSQVVISRGSVSKLKLVVEHFRFKEMTVWPPCCTMLDGVG